MSAEPITEIVDFLDEDFLPGVEEKDARYKVTYKLEDGEIIDKKIEVLLED